MFLRKPRSKILFYILAILTITVLLSYFTESLISRGKLNRLLVMAEETDNIRAMELPPQLREEFQEWRSEGNISY
jgi:hypothetical protein